MDLLFALLNTTVCTLLNITMKMSNSNLGKKVSNYTVIESYTNQSYMQCTKVPLFFF